MFNSVDLLEKLNEAQNSFEEQAKKILLDESEREQKILDTISVSSGYGDLIPVPEGEKIYDVNAIQQICEIYRLRFLPGKYFKAEIPYEAIVRIKELERKCGRELKEFMVLAPSTLFELKDEYEDPILFTPVGDNKFLFIHKWGNDMTWYRKLMYYPVRNFETYLRTLTTLAMIFALIVPWNWIVREYSLYEESYFYYRLMLFGSGLTWLFISTFYFLFVSRRNFSRSDWNNVYFNK